MPDMYAIQSSKATSEKDESTVQYTPNIIPCRVHHDGPVDSLDRYWMPVNDEKGICYFSTGIHKFPQRSETIRG